MIESTVDHIPAPLHTEASQCIAAPPRILRLRDGTHARIRELIGRGGFGSVWNLQHPCGPAVLKIAHTHDVMPTQERRQRMKREAAILASFDIDGIPRILGHGTTGDSPYLILERVTEGVSWRELLCEPRRAAHAWSTTHCVILFLTNFDTLAYVHDAGFLHRDLKPENLLIGRSRDCPRFLRAWIVDFGLAIPTRSLCTRLTPPGATAGTPRYLDPSTQPRTPEHDDENDVNHRSDTYGIAATWYEWWTGYPLWTAAQCAELLHRRARVLEDGASSEEFGVWFNTLLLRKRPAIADAEPHGYALWTLLLNMLACEGVPFAGNLTEHRRPSDRDIARRLLALLPGMPETLEDYRTLPPSSRLLPLDTIQ